jgi:ribosomal protein S18 acetylase RimI-like enzyme
LAVTDALQIRDFEPRYTRSLVALWRSSFEHGVGITDPHPLQEQQAFFESRVLPENRVRVALLGTTLAGFLASTPESIAHLYVAVPLIGRGIGSRLMALAKAQSSGSLWLCTFARNARARAFYERHGFADTGHGFENMWNLEDIRYVWSRQPRGDR